MKRLKEFWRLNEDALAHLIGALLALLIAGVIYLAGIAIVVYVIVLVLRAMGVHL